MARILVAAHLRVRHTEVVARIERIRIELERVTQRLLASG